jgi:hypothetical protein
MWEVHPSDRQTTKRWLRISTINVRHVEINVKHAEKEGYPYLLSNRTEGEYARANYLRDSARMSIAPEAAASKGKRPRGAGFRKDKTEVPPDQNIKLAFGAMIVVTRYPAFHQKREE